MREIEFRGKSKRTGKWVYGNLIVNKNGKYNICEVDERTIGQFVGEGEYGRIYEDMELYDEYAEENCTILWDEEDCGFRLIYNGVSERIESLDGLHIIEEKL